MARCSFALGDTYVEQCLDSGRVLGGLCIPVSICLNHHIMQSGVPF